GLLCKAEIVAQVVRSLRKVKERPLVVDPVMVATTGDVLLAPEAIQIYERKLLPLATLITPNLDEASRLLGDSIRDLAAMHRATNRTSHASRLRVTAGGCLRRHTQLIVIPNESRGIPP